MNVARNNYCDVELRWFVEYSGWYNAIISPDSTIKDVENQIPKIYPI